MIIVLSLFVMYALPTTIHGAESMDPTTEIQSTRLNNENWFTVDHPDVASFRVHEDGSASGVTVDQIPFTLSNVASSDGIRVQRFEIQDHYHFIVEGEAIFTIDALSRRLAVLESE